MKTTSDKPKICLIYTGGTIGMTRDRDGTLRPPEKPEDFYKIDPELKESIDIKFFTIENDDGTIMNKDSTNMIPDDWTKISKEIYNRRADGFDGFVIAHGTDTMHFSASAVAFALGKNLNFPVVFTGAQTAPDIHHGDARVNLLRAFKVAAKDIAEVVICFGDYVYRGCRAQKKDERRFDAFESPSFFPLAYITEEIIVSHLAKKRNDKREEIDFTPDFESATGKVKDIVFEPNFSSGICQVSLIPGLEPKLLRTLIFDAECKGIVLQSFGAGNVPNEGDFSWTGFIEESTDRGKPVLITSQFPANATLHTAYEPGRKAIEAGAIPTGNMTSACATAKFRWVLAHRDVVRLDGVKKLDKIKEMMNMSFIGELDEIDNMSE
ncbi:MAG: asparaginase [Treponema sp.]|nr:asparaginase [Treponema sp.]